ncbi:MAG: hypothetical protein ACI9SE_002447 [Neolewinella sp.]|jgi:hypothetical protein
MLEPLAIIGRYSHRSVQREAIEVRAQDTLQCHRCRGGRTLLAASHELTLFQVVQPHSATQ